MVEAVGVRRAPVIPAVDVLEGEAVRLERGDFVRVAVRAGDPIELVARFAAAGARLVHLVDLGGARSGRLRPELVAAAAAAAGDVPLQASGGIRSPADAEALVAAGAARVVIGTAAFAPGALDRYVQALGDRLVVAIDVRDDRVAVSGWEETVALTPEDAAHRCAAAGVARILCTAVARDGTLAGPDLDLLARVAAAFGGPVLAAGGIAEPRDLERLADVGIEAAVVGRALLEGRLPLTLLGA
jgi:phosphoribosylformimino-5-aminoimidazole carboxamide ribotide isomerase